MSETPNNKTAKHRYGRLEQDRRSFLDRARMCSALTIPSVLPREGFNRHSDLPTPFQSVGARGVRTMASKLLLSLFPSIPFFNYRVDDQTLAEIGAGRGEAEGMLASRERAVVTELETSSFRPQAWAVFVNLLVTGNVCIYIPSDPDKKSKAYKLDSYVVRRDHEGNVLEAIIKEELDFGALEPDIQQALLESGSYVKGEDDSLTDNPVELYTVFEADYESKMWHVHQEVETIKLEDSEGSYKFGMLPWLFLRLIAMPGESYGRSYCEEYLGDLDSLEALTETIVTGAAASAKVVFLVNPGGLTDLKEIADAKAGDVKSGRADDVQAMQVQKAMDLRVAREMAGEMTQRLAYAFLMNSAVQRDAERVTAEEVRYMAQELDDALGGVYTLLAAEFQLPVVKLFETRMEKRTGAGKLPEDVAKPVIVAGLEAIGRGHEQQNLRAFAAEIIQVLGPELAMQYLNPVEFMKRSAAAYNIETDGLIPSDEEIQQREQMAQMQQLIQHLGPQALQAGGGVAQEAMRQGAAAVAAQQGTPTQEGT